MGEIKTTQFAVCVDQNKVINKIGIAVVSSPPIHYNGEKTKWFDDNKNTCKSGREITIN